MLPVFIKLNNARNGKPIRINASMSTTILDRDAIDGGQPGAIVFDSDGTEIATVETPEEIDALITAKVHQLMGVSDSLFARQARAGR